ncbi:MAG: WecB/TagA/CpsF family glycosyltransferase [Aquabacterium sp.]|nr:WecB/TagA/CpsF family glycosyltransferase [Aquabacterium sp.]
MSTAREPDFNRPLYAVCGLPIDALTHVQAQQKLELNRETGQSCFMSTPNLNFAVQSLKDAAFRDSVARSDISVADGMPLVWIARLLGLPIVERVSGSGLFDSLKQAPGSPWKVFFFGGPQGAAQEACLKLYFAGTVMQPVGLIWPGFGGLDDMSRPDLIETINEARPDLLVVSLGSAKGQAWIERNLSHLKVPVVSHLGAVVNFVAGTVKRAPRWMQRTGLEWLWRIREEPHLVTRYFNDGLALCKLMTLRVLPLAISTRWYRATARGAHQPCTVRLALQDNGDQRVVLSGCAHATGMADVRRAWQDCWHGKGDVRIDLQDVPWFDAMFVALCLLLETSLRDQGRKLRLEGLTSRHRRLFRLHQCAHLVAA